MKHGGEPPEIAALKTRWCRWVDIVELFARRRVGLRRVDPQEYVLLHKELTQACRMLAQSANEVEGAFYRYLEDLVQPWLTPSVLARADREILIDLLVRCRQAERQLGVRSWLRSVPAWAPRALVVSLLVAIGILLIGTGDGGWLSGLGRLRGWSDDLWFALRHSSDVERLCFIGTVLIIVSIFTVSRTARS
jgi:hypothetical protein